MGNTKRLKVFMIITVKLFANLRVNRFEVEQITLKEGDTIETAMEKIHILKESVSIIFLNGKHSSFEKVLNDGDILSLFPPVGGG